MQKLRSENLNFLALAWAWYKHEIQILGQRVEGKERVPSLWFIWQLMPSSLHLSLPHSQRLCTMILQKWHRHGAERVYLACNQFARYIFECVNKKQFLNNTRIWEFEGVYELRTCVWTTCFLYAAFLLKIKNQMLPFEQPYKILHFINKLFFTKYLYFLRYRPICPSMSQIFHSFKFELFDL